VVRTSRKPVLRVHLSWRFFINRVAGLDEDPAVESVIVTEGAPPGAALAVLLPCLPDGTIDPELVDEHNEAALSDAGGGRSSMSLATGGPSSTSDTRGASSRGAVWTWRRQSKRSAHPDPSPSGSSTSPALPSGR
jgi:hypothetical protein